MFVPTTILLLATPPDGFGAATKTVFKRIGRLNYLRTVVWNISLSRAAKSNTQQVEFPRAGSPDYSNKFGGAITISVRCLLGANH